MSSTAQTAITPTAEIGFAKPQRTDLGRLARQGLGWSSLLLLGKYALSIATTAVLARLLSPKDYGLMAMVATITVMAQAISDFGLSWATVQREHLERSQIDALFLINCAFGLVLTALCCLAAPYAAAFYHRPELCKIVIAASGTLLLSALAVQPNALLLRQMKLKEFNQCALCSLLVSAIVTIALARMGFGYWALVLQMQLQQAIATALSFPLSGYFPRFPHLWNVGTLLTFGGYSAAFGIVNYVARNMDNILVGRFWGATALGYYSRAYFLMTLPGMLIIGVFSGTLIPAMAALRKEPAQMEAAYLRAVRLIAIVGCTFAVGLAATAPEVVEIVYGSQWRAVVPILLWLSVAGLIQPVQNTSQWLYIVAERGRGMLLMGLLVAGSATFAFALGIRSGPTGVARAYAIANTIVAYPVLLSGHRACGLSMSKTLAATVPLLVCAGVMGAAVYFVGAVCSASGMDIYVRFVIKTATGIIVYIVCLRRMARSTFSELVGYISRSYLSA
jgi:O-antigen/teichoic acid export membrane protein